MKKVLEIILLAIVGILLYVWGISEVLMFMVTGLCGLVLVIIDHELMPCGENQKVSPLQKVALEIIMLAILATALASWNVSINVGTAFFSFGVCIVLLLNNGYLRSGVLRTLYDIRAYPKYAILLLIVLVLMVIWGFSWESNFFVFLVLCFLFYHWNSRVLAAVAIIALVTCPILLLFDMEAEAEQMAVYAYLFLVMTVALQIVEYWHAQK